MENEIRELIEIYKIRIEIIKKDLRKIDPNKSPNRFNSLKSKLEVYEMVIYELMGAVG